MCGVALRGAAGTVCAAGATLAGPIEELKTAVVAELEHAIDAAGDTAKLA